MNRNQIWALVGLGALVFVALVAITAVLANRSGDEAAADSSTTSLTSTSSTTPSTSTSTSTTSSSTTTTTSAPTTTTSTSTTTTTTEPTTTSSSSTTTTLPPGVVLEPDGFGGVDFGASPEETIAYVVEALGPPSADSGWIDAFSIYGTCPMPVVRGVHWGSLVALFTQSQTDYASSGTEHFFSYYYTSNTAPATGLGTAANIFIGSSRSDLDAAYTGDLEIVDDEFGTFWRALQSGMSQLYGFLSGTDPVALVESINGGIGCGE